MQTSEEISIDGRTYFTLNGGVFENRGCGNFIFAGYLEGRTVEDVVRDYKPTTYKLESISIEEAIDKVIAGEMTAKVAAVLYMDPRYDYGMKYYEPHSKPGAFDAFSRILAEWKELTKERREREELLRARHEAWAEAQRRKMLASAVRCRVCGQSSWPDGANFTTMAGSNTCDDCLS